MIDFILIILLIFGFFIGLKRGFVLQAFHLIGFIAAFILAALYYDELAPRLALWIPYPELDNSSAWADFLEAIPLEGAFYSAIAFAIIFFAVKILLQIIASMLDFVADLPILHSLNKILGAVLGFVEIYLILFIVLYILALTPMPEIQAWMNDSFVALFIIEHTPFLSHEIKTLWSIGMDELIKAD
ncbi:putative transmembrane protein YshB [Lentibacillus kapialis]|uniref:Transmembrane protein YshB n=1 Tax=Lentibacillus kapialis TaxID=340214 RepID=A0A917PMP5_9BACI|nr:CvpA family protein [Lentibacillus kapialis]GGJ84473.1 putative transmembrane protein YshB [Lentibacillus kapialis]